jgi:hypothetical protein
MLIIRKFTINYKNWYFTGKKQENITNAEASEHKTNGSKSSEPSNSPEITKSGTKSITAELNAKITAKQNSRQQLIYPNGTKGIRSMDPPKLKHVLDHKTSRNFLLKHNDIHRDNYSDTKSALSHNDVESHLSSSRIPISDFKSKTAPTPVTLNLKKNYLWKRIKFHKLRKKDINLGTLN